MFGVLDSEKAAVHASTCRLWPMEDAHHYTGWQTVRNSLPINDAANRMPWLAARTSGVEPPVAARCYGPETPVAAGVRSTSDNKGCACHAPQLSWRPLWRRQRHLHTLIKPSMDRCLSMKKGFPGPAHVPAPRSARSYSPSPNARPHAPHRCSMALKLKTTSGTKLAVPNNLVSENSSDLSRPATSTLNLPTRW